MHVITVWTETYRWSAAFAVHQNGLTSFSKILFSLEITQLGDCKRVISLRSISEVQQLVVLGGKSHSVRLFFWDQIPDSTGVKIPEAKGCQAITSGLVCQGSTAVLCAASKRQVICFQLTNRKGPPRKIKEFQAPGVVQCMDLLGERVCVGYSSGFSFYPLLNEGAPFNLPHPDEPKLSFLAQTAHDALCAARLTLSEYLLCFSTFGVYVNADGKKSRSQEIMWPAPPLSCCEYSIMLVWCLLWYCSLWLSNFVFSV